MSLLAISKGGLQVLRYYGGQEADLYGSGWRTVEVSFISALRHKSLFGIRDKQSGEQSTEQ